MFSPDFYPTPSAVIERMVNGNDLHGRTVLEPSAGAGHILAYLAGLGATTVACEINAELAFIAKEKANRWLKNDFLEVTREEVSHIHHILMNPPFSADIKHILHAWEVAPAGCEIAALCNHETLERVHRTRQTSILNNLINTYGYSEELGECFTTAERKTNVKVTLIRLFKPGEESSFEEYFDFEPDTDVPQMNGLLPYNAVRDVVNRYVEALKLYDQVAEHAIKMNGLIGEFSRNDLTYILKSDDKPQSLETFKIKLQKNAWHWIFQKMNMQRFLTEKLKADLNKFVEQQTKVPFTMRNIYKMMDMVAQTHGQRMQQALIEVFDRLTMHYHDNRYNVEGWKTNSHYLVGQKFIFPWMVGMDYGKLNVRYNSHNTGTFEDLIKALDYLTGERRFEEVGCSLYSYIGKLNLTTNTWFDVAYFKAKGFKKGTLHCKWKSRKHWELFCRAVAEAKGWELPESI